jgi:iron complex outermembrane receptor protein
MPKLTQRVLSLLAVLLVAGAGLASAQERGRIEGRVTRSDGTPIAGVTVKLADRPVATLTGRDGGFSFDAVPVGTYDLELTLGDNREVVSGVAVAAGQAAEVDHQVDWEVTFVETITVFSASRRAERVVDAPAAVTVITAEEVERQAAHGQLPKLLEFTPGAEVTQSGLYDYNFNTRGFNSSLNRRVATLIDGRDPSVPFLGAQEWAAIAFPLDDLASVELVRGPSAALYGANASSGVLNLTTRRPRDSQGGLVRVAAGELSTTNGDFRWSGGLGGDFYLKTLAGIRSSGDFTVSRRGQAEYSVPCPVPQGAATDCLPQEATPLAIEDDDEVVFGSLRIDKYLAGGPLLTLEAGRTDIEGPAFQTGIGRVQLVEVERPYARFNFSSEHWNLLAYHNQRKAPRQLALASGSNVALDTENTVIELQTRWDLAGGDVRLVAGATYGEEEIDTADPDTGRQTLVFEPIDSDQQAVFGQIDWSVTPRFKLVLAGRYDESSLHDSQFSPKGSAVFSITPDHTLRATYNEAFQVANYSEFFLQANVAPPTNLAGLNALVCLANGFDCGLGLTRIIAVGNEDLELEEVKTWEVGYSGIIAGRGYVTVDYYNSKNENFITDLIPQLGTPLGRVNPNFGPWQAPTTVPAPFVPAIEQTIRGLVPLLTHNLDGTQIIAAVSYTNFGEVDTQGIELGVNYYFDDHWNGTFNYSWFDFEIQQDNTGLERLLLPNSPENQVSPGLGWVGQSFDVGASLRSVDDFRWVVGPFQGDVESYTTVDLNANYRFTDHWKVGVNVANLLDDEHWESFGGDLLGRRALGHVEFSW